MFLTGDLIHIKDSRIENWQGVLRVTGITPSGNLVIATKPSGVGWEASCFRFPTDEELAVRNFKSGQLVATPNGRLVFEWKTEYGGDLLYRHATRGEYLTYYKKESSFEMLHGKKARQKPKVTIEFVIKDPPAGWDLCSRGYCQGDFLIRQGESKWHVDHPLLTFKTTFNTPEEAANSVERFIRAMRILP